MLNLILCAPLKSYSELFAMTVSTYRTIRSHRNLSRQQLADKANVSARQIARIETAASPISLRTTTLERLAKALDVDVEVLLGRAPLPEGMDAANNLDGASEVKCDFSILGQVLIGV